MAPCARSQALGPVRPPYDVICGSDLIYYSYTPDTPHTALLLWTLRRLVAPTTRVYLSLSLHHNPEVRGGQAGGRAGGWVRER